MLIHKKILMLCIVLTLCLPAPALALANVSDWAVESVSAAQKLGLEPSVLLDADAEAPVTRAEFASIAVKTYKVVTGLEIAPTTAPIFPDTNDPAVASAFLLGLVSGRSDGTFAPDDTITRQELCIMLCNVIRASGLFAAEGGSLTDFPDHETVDWWAVHDVTTMVHYGIMNGVVLEGKLSLDPLGTASRQQALMLAHRFVESFGLVLEVSAPPDTEEDYLPEFDAPSSWDIYNTIIDLSIPIIMPEIDPDSKRYQVWGDREGYFESAAEAEANMTEVSVNVWRLQANGSKVTGKAYIQVNKNLASIVREIFEEIYNGPEQFPIKVVGGYAWRPSPTSEHRWGTAIDINPDENFEATIAEDGSLIATTGKYWKPGVDPYSIPADGDVVRAFKSHGFSWGGDAWRTKRDFMHFSYFGR